MDAIKLLKDDHQELRGFFQSYKASDSDGEKHKIFEQIKQKLEVHTHIEEEVFYPEISKKKGLEDITKEGIEEHHVADVLVREISKLTRGSEKFEPKMDVLIESTEHHLQEEEGEMFPKVEDKFTNSELEELGSQMEQERKSFQKSKSAKA